MKRLVVLLGPTAVGKTKLSIALAKRLNTDIISGDSMLIYRGMNIGTAKPSLAEQAGVVHHLINILDPAQEYTVADFQQQAHHIINKLNIQGKIPILAGGTGLYIKALLEGYNFAEAAGDTAFRDKLQLLAEQHGNKFLHDMLVKVNPQAAAKLHVNNVRRIIRQLEICHLLKNKPDTAVITQTNSGVRLQYDAVVIGLTMERANLYDRINSRVELMVEQGLVAEVKSLLASGVSPDAQSMQAIGYKEMVSYLQGKLSLAEVISVIQQSTRHFAKRQLTWYRKMPYIKWIAVDQGQTDAQIVEIIFQCIAEKFNLK